MITQYELLYIIPSTFTDEDVGRIELNVKALLEKQGATLDSTTRLGKFRFAYPIKDARHGHYVMVRFTSEGAKIAAIEEVLRISNEVLRHIILRADEAGGDKFELVQFTEINLDNKEDDRGRRRTEEKKPEMKTVASTDEEPAKDAAAAPAISAEDLEKKIDTALQDKV